MTRVWFALLLVALALTTSGCFMYTKYDREIAECIESNGVIKVTLEVDHNSDSGSSAIPAQFSEACELVKEMVAP